MNIPKVRFHGFKEKWREESLSKLFVERHEISTITESLPQLSFTISEGVIYPDDRKSNKRDFLIKDILSKKYLVTCVGDILYNPANVIYGAIHRNSLCDGVVSPIYKIFKTEQDSNFMECVVRNPSFISQLSMKTEGTVTKLKTLKPESFLEMIVKIAPSIYEQRKIASYFQTLDSLIQTTSKKLASLKQIKAASLQSMFPQEGETVPKVRFKGFEGEWKKIQLNKCLDISNNINIHNTYGIRDVLSISDEAGVVNQIEFLGRSFAGKSLQKYKILKTNQLVYTKSPLKAKPYGIIKKNFNRTGIVSTLYAIYDCKDNVSSEFIHYYFDPCYRINQYLSPLVNKGAKNTMNISDETALSGEIWIPSLQEQQKIASYFCNLDKQISLQTQRLEKLKQIKAACLDKMFV